MNYIQIEIGGKLRGWKVNQMMLEVWSKFRSTGDYTLMDTYAAVYAGLIANCYVKHEEPDFTFEDVCDWCDQLSADALALIKSTFEQSDVYIKLLESIESALRVTKEITEKKNKHKAK